MDLLCNIRIAQALGHAASYRDHETGTHNIRVAYMSSIFGEVLNLPQQELQALMKGAFLHDIGKITIQDRILLKNAALTDDEWEVMKTHAILGKKFIEDLPWFKDALDVIVHHHEKFDGSGYPSALQAEEIPLNARIFAIIDVFDALLSPRPYKKAFSYEKTVKILEEVKGTHFEPLLLEKFLPISAELAQTIATNTSDDLKNKLEARKKKIFGI